MSIPTDDMREKTNSRLNCLTTMETQQTQIYHVEGGILLTESCTDGEAVVAAETDEFYAAGLQQLHLRGSNIAMQGMSNFPRQCDNPENFDNDDAKFTAKERSSIDTTSDDCCDELPVDTVQNDDLLETMHSQQTGTDNEDLILENVQNFINMAYL